MGDIHQPKPVLLILAAFSCDPAAMDWARATAVDAWGPVALSSDAFDFTETDYYQATMGAKLKKQFLAFERLGDPGDLPRIKRQTNEWEAVYAKMESQGRGGKGGSEQDIRRPLNLDPGYITEAKVVLASTKDHAHRIYLADGIYAEVTLHFQNRKWRHRDWTFPDYRRDDYHAFFTECRDYLRTRRRKGGPA